LLFLNQVTASPIAGMLGTEHCDLERWAFRFSAPRKLFSPASGSVLQNLPQLALQNGTGRS